MEERRRQDDKNWEEINKFIHESREYRAGDSVRQENLLKSVDELNDKVKIQNGRIGKLEDKTEKADKTYAVVFGGENQVGISHQMNTLVGIAVKILWLAASAVILASLPAVAEFIAKVMHK